MNNLEYLELNKSIIKRILKLNKLKVLKLFDCKNFDKLSNNMIYLNKLYLYNTKIKVISNNYVNLNNYVNFNTLYIDKCKYIKKFSKYFINLKHLHIEACYKIKSLSKHLLILEVYI